MGLSVHELYIWIADLHRASLSPVVLTLTVVLTGSTGHNFKGR